MQERFCIDFAAIPRDFKIPQGEDCTIIKVKVMLLVNARKTLTDSLRFLEIDHKILERGDG